MAHMISISLSRTIRTPDKETKQRAIDAIRSELRMKRYNKLRLCYIPKEPVRPDGSFANFIKVDTIITYTFEEDYDPNDGNSAFNFYLWQREWSKLFDEFCDNVVAMSKHEYRIKIES